VQVGHHEIDGEHWFLVRHGDTYARTAAVERDTPVLNYRPAKDDVVVSAPEFDELRIHAGTKGEKALYRTNFGQYLHGDPNFFSVPKAYGLDRLRTHPEEALSVEGFPGIKQVLLVEVELRWPGAFKDAIVKKSKNIFGSAAASKPPRKAVPDTGRLTRAKFEFLFDGETKPQTVTVKPVNELKVARRWLVSGFFMVKEAAPLSGARPVCSIPVRHHHGDGGLRVVNIERAAGGDELDQPGPLGVGLAHVERNGDAVRSGP